MTVKAIHQLVAGFARGDAISNEARYLQTLFKSWGLESDIFCERRRILPEWRNQARDLDAVAAACGSTGIALLHLSIGSAANTCFAQLHCPRALLYHNITPPDYFRWFQPAMALDLARGRKQMAMLSQAANVVMADSAFNAGELSAMGYAKPVVFPLALDFEILERSTDRSVERRFRDGKTNVLFVGRCAPNKRIEDILTVFAHYQKSVNPNARLILAGSWAGMERYFFWLNSLIREWRLRDVVFLGAIPQPMLNAAYRVADVFLCMSDHEGFGIPLMESMAFGLPIVAYHAAAVPETLGGAGILTPHRNPAAIAEMIGYLVNTPSFRQAIVNGQTQRLQRYRSRDIEAELREHLAPLLDA